MKKVDARRTSNISSKPQVQSKKSPRKSKRKAESLMEEPKSSTENLEIFMDQSLPKEPPQLEDIIEEKKVLLEDIPKTLHHEDYVEVSKIEDREVQSKKEKSVGSQRHQGAEY